MSDEPKRRFRFGLRLLLLVVALLASLFAWRHAVEQRNSAEGEQRRMALEYRLAGEEDRRATMLRYLRDFETAGVNVASALQKADAKIAALKGALNDLMPEEDRERLKRAEEEKHKRLKRAEELRRWEEFFSG